jgi:general secretion pathway protein D
LPAQQIILKTQTPLTKREAIQAFDSVLALNGISMLNMGDKFVKAVPVAQANQEGVPFSKLESGMLPDLGQYVTHIIQLTNARPSEMVQVLQPFAKIPNSILPVDSSQILVLRDYTENVKRMLELIKQVDVAVPSEFVDEVIPIKYALASEIASALNALSSGGGGATVGGGTTGGTSGSRGGRAFGTGGPAGMGGMGSSGYRSGMNQPGMNPMGTTGTMGAGATGTGGTFSDRLQQIIRKASVSGEIVVLGQTKIISDERTNSLLIYASREDMKTIKSIIEKLDVVLAQVLIESVIIEVSIGDTKDFGFSYLAPPHGSGNYTGAGAILNNANFRNPSDIISGSTNAISGGFSYFGRWGNDLEFAVRAVATDNRAKIIQRPRIQTSHAVEANLFVGESRPYPTGTSYGGYAGSYSSIQQLQIGVTLSVTPLINPDGLVVMDIHQTIESYNGFVKIDNIGEVPITTRKEAMAKVAVRDRDTIIVGGLIENSSSKSGSGVPYLMDIPLIGFFFRSTGAKANRNELIVLIRPTVLPTPEVAAITAMSEKHKMPGVRRAELEERDDEARRLKLVDEELRAFEPLPPTDSAQPAPGGQPQTAAPAPAAKSSKPSKPTKKVFEDYTFDEEGKVIPQSNGSNQAP